MISLLCTDLKQVAYYLLGYNFAINSLSIFTKVFAEGFTLSMVADVHAAGDTARLHKIFDAIFEYIYLFAVPIAVGGLLLGGPIIRVMYGPEGLGAVGPAVFFLVVMALGKYQGLTANFLGAMDKETALIVSRAIFAALNLGMNLMLIPKYGAWGAVIGTSTATITGLVYETYLLHVTLHPKYPVKFIGKVLLSSLVMAAGIFVLCRFLPDSDKLRVAVALPAGGVIYVAALLATRPISPQLVELVGRMNAPGAKLFSKMLMPKSEV
jgi:O-antigen/teichoic acid export membrane protein